MLQILILRERYFQLKNKLNAYLKGRVTLDDTSKVLCVPWKSLETRQPHFLIPVFPYLIELVYPLKSVNLQTPCKNSIWLTSSMVRAMMINLSLNYFNVLLIISIRLLCFSRVVNNNSIEYLPREVFKGSKNILSM